LGEKIKEDEMEGTYNAQGREMRIAYKIFARKLEGKRPHWRPRRRWKGNIRLELMERVCKVMDWMHQCQD